MEQKLRAAHVAEQGLRVSADELMQEKAKKYKRLLHDARRELEDTDRLCKGYEDELQQLKKEMERKRRRRADKQLSLTERRAREERESTARRQGPDQKDEAAGRRKREEEEKLRRQRRLVLEQEAIAEQKREEENLQGQRAVSMKLERGRKRQIMKRNLLPMLGMLAGVGVIAAGGATMQIPLIGAGIGLIGTAVAKLSKGPSNKKKD